MVNEGPIATFCFELDEVERNDSEFQAQLTIDNRYPTTKECRRIAKEFGLKLVSPVQDDCPGLWLVSGFPQWFVDAMGEVNCGWLENGMYRVDVEMP